MRGTALGLLFAAAPSFWSASARAEAEGVQLVWVRPVGSLCPSRSVLESDVEQIMGRRAFGSEADARVIVRGAIADDASGVHVRLEARAIDGVSLGTRELSAPAGQCASLRDAIALILTLFVEREAELARSGSSRIGFGVSARVVSLPLPRATVGGGPSLSLELGSLIRLGADLAYFWPVAIQTQRGVGARLYAWSLALRACAAVWADPGMFTLRVCLGTELGAVTATPLSLEGPARQTRLLAQGALDLRWETQLGRFALLDVAAGPLLSFSRPVYFYVRSDRERMDVYRPDRLGIFFQVAFIILGS